jgi:hypothetical protein
MFTPEVLNNFYAALSVTWKGMAGIFIFMAVFYLVIKLLDKLFPQKHQQ